MMFGQTTDDGAASGATEKTRLVSRWAGPAVMIVAGLLIGLALSELVASLLYPRPQQFYVRRPNLRRTFSPLEDVMPGVRGPTRFITNSLGIRGDEFAESQQYRILAVGGSTTECVYLDQDRAWPSLIQRILAEATGLRVWVGNVGISDAFPAALSGCTCPTSAGVNGWP